MAENIVPTFEEFTDAVLSNDFPAPRWEQYRFFAQFIQPIGKISSKREAAMILAQMIHESAGLTEKEERGYRHKVYEGNWPEDIEVRQLFPNRSYHGRGYLNLTYGSNYRKIGVHLGMGDELAENPDRVTLEEELAWKTAFAQWAVQVHTRVDVLAGHFGASSLSNDGLVEAGNEGLDMENQGTKDRWEIYRNVHRAFKLEPSDCQYE